MLGLIASFCTSLNIDSKTSILSFIVLVLFWRLVAQNRRKVLLSKIPGPKGYPIVGNLFDLLVPREQLFKDHVERHEKYGSIYKLRLGNIGSVHVCDPEFFEEILHSSKHLKKGFGYKFVQPFLGSGLITSAGSKWLSHRKILTPAFHFKILDSFFDVFREQGKAFIEKLDVKAKEGKEFDIYDYVKHCALDVICEAAMGVKFNAQNTEHCQYVQSVLRISAIIVERFRKLWLHPDFIFNRTALGKEHEKHLEIVHGFVENVIRERKRHVRSRESVKGSGDYENEDVKKPRRAFLDLLLATAESENTNLTDKDIREEVDTFMFAGVATQSKSSESKSPAELQNTLTLTPSDILWITSNNTSDFLFFCGLSCTRREITEQAVTDTNLAMCKGHDTTTAAITWAIYLLGLHPEIQEEVYKEQKSIFQGDMERPITQEDLTKMNLLDRVMKECIRLYPSVPFISRTLDEDVKFGQYIVPKNTTVGLQIFALHRNPNVYPEPHKFDPDRFLPENVEKRHSYAYVPFSAGPRNCIGKRFALFEEKFMLASLLRRYQIKSMEKPEDLKLVGELILRPLSGVRVILGRRSEL